MYRKPWEVPEILAYLGLRLWQHTQEDSTAAEVTGSRKIIIIPRIQLCPSDPTIPFKLRRRRFAIKIALAMKISTAQWQMLKNDGKYLPSSVLLHGQLCVVFYKFSLFHNADIAILTGLGNAHKL
jgi:hypothetical protein